MRHLAGSLSLLLSLKPEGLPCHPRGVLCYLKVICKAPPQPKKGRDSAWCWSLGSQRDLRCGPSFTLGWDKPGSVAPLRLVGCLIETPAPSWAYFYSIFFSLFFFPSPAQTSLALFFQSSTFAFSVCFLPYCALLLYCWAVFHSLCMIDLLTFFKTCRLWFLIWLLILSLPPLKSCMRHT